MNDQAWQAIRYVLIAGGGFIAGKFNVPISDVPSYADTIIQVLGLLISAGSAAWGLYVKFSTRSVPATTAARADVPTVSPVTGKVQP